MKNLKLVQSGIDTRPFLEEIEANPESWYGDTTRQDLITTQRDTKAIALRAHADTAAQDARVRRAKPFKYLGKPSPMAASFPHACNYVEELVGSMQGTMGRAVLTNLRPQGKICPHIDDGLYWLLRDRYHLVIKSVKGSYFKVGGEEVRMQEGELWWFDPTVSHEAFNDSDQDRIHIIVDVMSKQSMGTFRRRLMRSPLRGVRSFYKAAVRGTAWPIKERFFQPSTT